MGEDRTKILSESNRIISKLQLLSVFFKNELVYKIYLQSQVIHKSFENDTELDINKLELFHLQFTESIIELLKRVKTKNEKNATLLLNEIQVNKDLIENINDSAYTENDFQSEKSKQATKLNLSLKKLYRVLSEDSKEYPFSTNLEIFSSHFSESFFGSISSDLLTELIQFSPSDVYTTDRVTIQKKLLGLLLKNDFNVEFWGGFKTGKSSVEIYKITSIDKYFIFFPASNLFLLCDFSEISALDQTNTLSKSANFVQELLNKNIILESRFEETKTTLPSELTNLFNEYYEKITNLDFLQNIYNFDTQANILKTMLNTNSF